MSKKKPHRGPEPWYRPSRGLWYVTIHGIQHKLGPGPKNNIPEEALQRFHALLAEPPEKPKASVPVATSQVVGVLDKFLSWCQEHRKPKTFEWYRWRLQLFTDFIGTELPTESLKHYHVDDFLARYPSWAPGMKRTAARAVQRAMRWAMKKGYIEKNPVADYEKPAQGRRTVVVSPDEFRAILSLCPSPQFRDLLEVTWETGCRPQEALAVEARHVDERHTRWLFTPDESKGELWPRVVYLTSRALEITQRLMHLYPAGKLLRNDHGNAWDPFAVNCAFCRLQMRMGLKRMKELGISVESVQRFDRRLYGDPLELKKARADQRQRLKERTKRVAKLACEHAPKYCLYNLRHSWLDRALKSGMDALTAAILMGHRDPSTVAKVYQHVSQSPAYLQEAVKRIMREGA
jgi:integrase